MPSSSVFSPASADDAIFEDNRTSWLDRMETIFAIASRDRKTRFAGGAFGYLWAFVTPVVWIAMFVLFFRLIGRSVPIYTAPELFVATGILPFVLFRQSITSLTRAAITSRHLLYIPSVSVADLTLATAALELVNAALTSFLIFGGIHILLDLPLPTSLSSVYVGILLAWFFGVSLGRLFAALGRWSDTFARIVPLLLRPMFWISGLFFTAIELPGRALDFLWYNPLFHCIELVREGYFLGFESPVSSVSYPFMVSLTIFALAGVVEAAVDRKRLARHAL